VSGPMHEMRAYVASGAEPTAHYCRPCGAFIGEEGMIQRAAPGLCVECAAEDEPASGSPAATEGSDR
jgi:hypothetical protein